MMGLLGFLKSKEQPEAVTFPADLGAVTKGQCLAMEQIPDPVFSTGVLGQCCGIEPEEGMIYAPIDGKITQVADTLHVVGLEAGGMDILYPDPCWCGSRGGDKGSWLDRARGAEAIRRG